MSRGRALVERLIADIAATSELQPWLAGERVYEQPSAGKTARLRGDRSEFFEAELWLSADAALGVDFHVDQDDSLTLFVLGQRVVAAMTELVGRPWPPCDKSHLHERQLHLAERDSQVFWRCPTDSASIVEVGSLG